jgi:uncharacterized protein YbjQ (UPF0145 family)
MGGLELLVFLALLALGYGVGRWHEQEHYRSILSREERLRKLLIIQSRFPPPLERPPQSQLVAGSVVVSVDFFKVFVANLRSLIGGRLTAYESLIDRARREAVLRMKAEAQKLGASMIVNVKFQTFAIGGRSQNSVRGVELLAYGTALAR